MEYTLPHGKTVTVDRVQRLDDAGPVVLRMESGASDEQRSQGRRLLLEACRSCKRAAEAP